MSKKNINDKSQKYKSEIKNAFDSFEPDNDGTINIKHLNDCTKINDLNKNNKFIQDSIKSLTSQKKEEKEEFISSDEYISFFDEQLNDINSKEGLEKIFCALSEGNDKSISWMKLPSIMKELGNDDMANNLMKLIEQGKLFNKELNFKDFCEIMNEDFDKNLKILNETNDYIIKGSYKEIKNTRNKNKEESEDMGTSSSKNEDPKISIENNEGEKSNKRYHRRYRDTKNKDKMENNENGNENNYNNKVQTKYRKKK